MDPWLEAASEWPGLHEFLITETARTLNHRLSPGYRAKVGERLYIVEHARSIYPDVAVVREGDSRSGPTSSQSAETDAAVDVCDPPLVLTVTPEEVRETFLEIVSTDAASRVVTHMEFLSPRNKSAGEHGRNLYLQKQREVLSGPVHLVEIDLIRRGRFTVAAPQSKLAEHGPWHYVVSKHRSDANGRFDVWAWLVSERMPRFRLPLDAGDEEVVVDLQEIFARCYEDGAFDRSIDYTADPPPPAFNSPETEWIKERLPNG